MITLKCPNCGAEAKLSLADTSYSGPRRCWKCHEFFTITIHNNQLTSCEPLSKEEYERQQEAKKIAEKMGGGMGFSRQQQPPIPQNPPVKPRSTIDSSKPEQLDFFKKAAETSRGGIDFVKREEPVISKNPPEKPQSSPASVKPEEIDFFRKAAETSKGGIDFVKRDEPTISPKTVEKPQGGVDAAKPEEPATPKRPMDMLWDSLKSSKPKTPPSRTEPERPAIFPPERYNTFVPQEDIKVEPGTPPKSKKTTRQADEDVPAIFPPERYNTFVPLEDEKPEKP